jgi:hypothetical protein
MGNSISFIHKKPGKKEACLSSANITENLEWPGNQNYLHLCILGAKIFSFTLFAA